MGETTLEGFVKHGGIPSAWLGLAKPAVKRETGSRIWLRTGQISEESSVGRFLGACNPVCHNVAESRSPGLQSYPGYMGNRRSTLNGLHRPRDTTHSGLNLFFCRTQGSSFLPTLGYGIPSPSGNSLEEVCLLHGKIRPFAWHTHPCRGS
jgi:hypothetical protein